MAKSIFRGFEVIAGTETVNIQLNKLFVNEQDEVETIDSPVYDGPSVEDLQKEAEEFKLKWEAEKAEMIENSKAEADKILKDAETAAFNEVKRQTDEALVISQKARDEADKIIDDARKQAASIVFEAEEKQADVKKKGYDEGFSAGREEGFRTGSLEVQRLTDRLHSLIERTMDKRQEILSETEQQIVDLVLLMTRKVVKVISENQRNVIISNVVHALRKVKGRGDVVIRVNLSDIGMTTEHIKNFISSAENVKNITVVEDLNVDTGGCVIETDFGSIDARIASQLHELEQKILEISPIKTNIKKGNV